MDSRNKILIVDDSEINRSLLSDILSANYTILEASNGLEAVSILNSMNAEISLLLLDIVMPQMDGFEVLSLMNRNEWIQSIPVIMISSEIGTSYIDRAYDLGATDYITRPFDEKTVLRRVQNTVMLYTRQKTLQNMVVEQIMARERNNSQMVEILSNIVEFRNGESGLHVLHIRIITDKLLLSLRCRAPQYGLSSSQIALIANASALHDIGKISIDADILNKPGRLTPEEFEIMKTHTVIGAEMLERVNTSGDSGLIKFAHDICRWHHERYDGRGYPDGLKGDEIPLAAQVVALADVYDALTSKRVYKPAYEHDVAIQMILRGDCGVFNPLLLECLVELSDWLANDLGIHSHQGASVFELQNITSELLAHNELKASGRTLTLLEQERMKYRFYASISKEIMFEYVCASDLLEFSEWGAKYLGLPELVSNPMESPEIHALGMEAYRNIKASFANNPDEVVNTVLSLTVHGQPHWFRAIVRTLGDGEEEGSYAKVIGKLIDIHDDQIRLNKLEEMSKRDSLTSLYNHGATQDIIEATLASNGAMQKHYLLALIDLDKFKSANDRHGHQFGDRVLLHVATLLRHCLRQGDIVGRIGGDEFLVFMECGNAAEMLVQRIFDTAETRNPLEGFHVSFSLGAAVYPRDGVDYTTLLRHADMALYAAKQDPARSYRFYDDTVPDFPSVRTPIETFSADRDSR